LSVPHSCSTGSNGDFATGDLIPGAYTLQAQWDGRREAGQPWRYTKQAKFTLTVPDEVGPVDIADILTPSASTQAFGYSRAQVDTLLEDLVTGGDNAPTGTPEGTRLYWDRTNRALYIGDDGAWTLLFSL